jgi:hypothetical protein
MDIQNMNVQVAVRVRPANNKELAAKDECCLQTNENSVMKYSNLDYIAIEWESIHIRSCL